MKIKYVNSEKEFEINEDDWNKILEHTDRVYLTARGCRLYSKIYKKNFQLGRFILGLLEDDGRNVDHIDRDCHNHKKENLRIVSLSASCMNRGKWKTREFTSKYKGVFWNPVLKNWRVCIYANKERYGGGQFLNEIDAAKKANELMLKHHGKFAVLNII